MIKLDTMNEKQNFIFLLLIMKALCLAVAASAITILYNAAFHEEERRMLTLLHSQGALIDAVAHHAQADSPGFYSENAKHEVLSQVVKGHALFRATGNREEFLVAHIENDQICFVGDSVRANGHARIPHGSVASDLAQPMRRALMGQSGTMVGRDYENVMVLAAYKPLVPLGLGLVVKKDIAEIRRPFVEAGSTVLLISLVAIGLGALLFRRISSPMIIKMKEHNRVLAASEQKYHRLYTSLQDGFVRVNMAGDLLEVNKAYADMLGYTEADFYSKSYMELTPGKWHAMEADIVSEQILVRGYSDIYEKEYIRQDGSIFPVELRTFLLPNAAGQPEEMWALVRDISERKRLEQEVAVREERFNAFFNTAPAGLVMHDPDGRYVKINDTLAQLNGLGSAEYVGRYPHDVLPQELADIVHGMIRKVAISGQPMVDVEVEAADPLEPSRQKWWVSAMFPFRDHDARVVGVGAVVVDVTKQKESEKALQYSLAEKETLLKEMHHRVKNNMQVIASLLSLQARKSAEASTRLVLEECQLRVRSMALVHEKLYRSKSLRFINFGEYLHTLSREVVSSISHNGAAANIVIVADEISLPVDAAIPLGLIINELVTNSVKHAFAGGVTVPEIRINFERQADKQLCLRVGDNGRGLPAGFTIAGSDSLGLSLINNLARQLGADLQFQNDSGLECCISFRDPLEESDG